MSVIDAASTIYNPVITSTGKLLLDKIAEAAAVVEDNSRGAAVRILMSSKRAADLAVLQSSTGVSTYGNVFAPATQDELIKRGVKGDILGLEIITIPKRQDGSSIISSDAVYVLGPAELVGVMAIRADLEVRTQPALLQMSDIISYTEYVGYLIRYSKAIQKIVIA